MVRRTICARAIDVKLKVAWSRKGQSESRTLMTLKLSNAMMELLAAMMTPKTALL